MKKFKVDDIVYIKKLITKDSEGYEYLIGKRGVITHIYSGRGFNIRCYFKEIDEANMFKSSELELFIPIVKTKKIGKQ